MRKREGAASVTRPLFNLYINKFKEELLLLRGG